MSYLVLARKWRPRTFSELVGQDSVVRALEFALAQGRMHHAYLFSGIRGVGKTTIARIMAKALNCEVGVGPHPCGTCGSCQEIDGGRFADMIEVDAASRTKVDDTRELLDNVQYAPTRGRYKVYLIDEVHMLSQHSFNALLKTLEEPPPHVKFILATTDPQKLPVTVLSRCLKFPLRRVSDTQLRAHLARILAEEGLVYDADALVPLARAADGSVRDALSLLDQAIAAGGGEVRLEAVRDMLGSVAPDLLRRLLEALAAEEGSRLLEILDEAYALGVAPDALLAELLRVLHDVAVGQAIPRDAMDTWLGEIGRKLSPELVQLYYEIGCVGRRQMAVAPDPESGMRMTILRMLAFRPKDASAPEMKGFGKPPGDRAPAPSTSVARGRGGEGASRGQEPAEEVKAADRSPPMASVTAALRTEGVSRPERPGASEGAQALDRPAPSPGPRTGREVLESLPLKGLARELAMNATLAREGDCVSLTIDPSVGNLLNKDRSDMLKDALCAYYKETVRLEVIVGAVSGTPVHVKREALETAQREAQEALATDPGIAALKRTFNARINEGSVRPRNEK